MLDQFAKTAWEASVEDDQSRGRLDILTSYYDLANADTRVLIEWLLKPREQRSKSWLEWIGNLYLGKVYKRFDARYVLAELLHTSHCRNVYDIVIIDCPPRLTSGSIQALCASSHVLLPTQLDLTSADYITRYSQQILNLKEDRICPHIDVIGIIPTRYQAHTRASRDGLRRLLELKQRNKLQIDVVEAENFIPLTTQLFNAEIDGIAYINIGDTKDVKPLKIAIENCADLVRRKMGL